MPSLFSNPIPDSSFIVDVLLAPSARAVPHNVGVVELVCLDDFSVRLISAAGPKKRSAKLGRAEGRRGSELETRML